ncbi:MAG: pyrimidine/purine nucleosidase domain-containing protein, partial [Pseudomonadota bacterium]
MATDNVGVDTEVWPEGSLETLSQMETDLLRTKGEGSLYPLLRRCVLAVLNSGAEVDDARVVLETYRNFEVGFHLGKGFEAAFRP